MHSTTCQQRSWPAALHLQFAARGERTILAHQQHSGPLRVQRPFHPEGPACPHIYLLHPPGGLVPGDSLSINIEATGGAAALITTPSAGRVYASDRHGHLQTQQTRLRMERGSCLEWLPQETIVFDRANSQQSLHIEAEGDARFFAWDLLVLGRTGSAAPFEQGLCRQHVEVSIDRVPVLCEQITVRGGDALAAADWGLQGCTVSGLWICAMGSVAEARTALSLLRTALDAPVACGARVASGAPLALGLTRKDSLLIGRILGQDSESVRQVFLECWSRLRPALNGRPACVPRIWAT